MTDRKQLRYIGSYYNSCVNFVNKRFSQNNIYYLLHVTSCLQYLGKLENEWLAIYKFMSSKL